MMYFLKAIIFFAMISLTLATSCTTSDSSPWPFGDSSDSSSSSGGGPGTDGCAQFDQDSAQYQACQETALQGQCNSAGGDDCSDSSGDNGDLISDPGDDLISSGDSSGDSGLIRRLLEARGTLTCSSSETCYQYSNKSLVCYNMATSGYHDDAGGKGNLLDGTYTAADEDVSGGTTSGSRGITATGSTPTHTGASGGSSVSSTAGAVSDAKATTGTATGASASPTSGGEILKAHALVGALGLGAAFFL